jgi:hypothetical protein
VRDLQLLRSVPAGLIGEVARRARKIETEFPIVYMSGAAAADWTSKGVPNSIMLAKPFAPVIT